MALPAGSFGNPYAARDDWQSWLPLLLGIGGLAAMYFMGKARGRAEASSGTQGLQGLGCGSGCGCKPCQQRQW